MWCILDCLTADYFCALDRMIGRPAHVLIPNPLIVEGLKSDEEQLVEVGFSQSTGILTPLQPS